MPADFIFAGMTKPFRFLSALSAFSAVLALTWAARAAEPANSVIALKATRLFDGKSKALITNGVVIVEGDKITDAGSNLPIPQRRAGHRSRRRDAFAGIHGCAHAPDGRLLGELPGRRGCAIYKQVASEESIRRDPNARVTIEAGFTTVRDVGGGRLC